MHVVFICAGFIKTESEIELYESIKRLFFE